KIGMNRSATVAPRRPKATVSVPTGWSSQWRNTKGITTRIAAGLLDRAVMASSRPRQAAGPHYRTRRREEPNASVNENQCLAGDPGDRGQLTRSILAEAAPSEAEYSVQHGHRTRVCDLRTRHDHANHHANPPRFERRCGRL